MTSEQNEFVLKHEKNPRVSAKSIQSVFHPTKKINQRSLIFLLVITFCEDSSFVGMTSEQRKNPRASAKPIQSVFHPVLTFFFFCHYVLRRLLRQFAVARVLLRRNDKRTEKKSAIICYIHLIHVPSRFDILLFLSFRRRRNRTRALPIFMI